MAIDQLRSPDLISICAGLSGYCSVFYGFHAKLELAGSFILLASILDGLDGLVARRYGKGKLGRYLDSLADLISFGVAPGVLIYLMVPYLWLGLLGAGIYLGCVMLRLARYCELGSEREFEGLPSACGGYLAGLGAIAHVPGWLIWLGCLILCPLMLANYQHPKLEDPRILLGAGCVLGSTVLGCWLGWELSWIPAGIGLSMLAIYISLPLWIKPR